MQFSCPRCRKLLTVSEPDPGNGFAIECGCGQRIDYGLTPDGTFIISRRVEPPKPWYGKPPDVTGIFRVPGEQEGNLDNRQYLFTTNPKQGNSVFYGAWVGKMEEKESELDLIIFSTADENDFFTVTQKINYLLTILAKYQQAEKYEDCARLRDRIQELQSQIQ